MNAIRFIKSNTTNNLAALTGLIQESNTKKVILFASPHSPTEGFTRTDGAENNLPLISALAICEIPKIAIHHIVFDGAFLTAARLSRYIEVKHLLDIAEKSEKVFFFESRAPFTSSLTPDKAAQILSQLEPIKLLNPESRAIYFSLLSNLTEKQYREI